MQNWVREGRVADQTRVHAGRVVDQNWVHEGRIAACGATSPSFEKDAEVKLAAEQKTTCSPQLVAWEEGVVVCIFVLTSKAGLPLNGQLGRIAGFDPCSDRFMVRLDAAGHPVKIKEQNIMPVDVEGEDDGGEEDELARWDVEGA